MQKAPVMKGSGLAPIDDEPVHVFGRNLESRVVETRVEEPKEEETKQEEDDVETIKKRKFEAITGEEDEETVFQGEFKLFVWDTSTSNWIEKGRGQLKLNDDLEGRRSRLIMRTGGTFRIILNVAIRHSFFKVISNTKTSIRFSDSQNVWAASGSNAKQLGDLLNDRIADAVTEKEEEEEKVEEASRTKEPEIVQGKSEETDNKVKEEQKQENIDEQSSSAGDVEQTDDTSSQTRQSVTESPKEGEVAVDDEKDAKINKAESDSEDNQEQAVDQKSEEQDDTKEEEEEEDADSNTRDEDEEHYSSRDETKRLKLSSD